MLLDVLDALTSSRLNKGNSIGMQECFCHGGSAGSGKVLAGLGCPQKPGVQPVYKGIQLSNQSTRGHLELCSCFHRDSILGHREFMDSAVRWVDGGMPCKYYSTCRRDTAREITNFHIHYFTGWCVKLQPDNKLLHKNSANTNISEVLMRTQLLQANISRFAILPKEQRKRMSA